MMFREKLKYEILEYKEMSLLPWKDRSCPRKLVTWGTRECRAGFPSTMMGDNRDLSRHMQEMSLPRYISQLGFG